MCDVGEGLTERTFFHAAGKKGWSRTRTAKAWAWLEARRRDPVHAWTHLVRAGVVLDALDTITPDMLKPQENDGAAALTKERQGSQPLFDIKLREPLSAQGQEELKAIGIQVCDLIHRDRDRAPAAAVQATEVDQVSTGSTANPCAGQQTARDLHLRLSKAIELASCDSALTNGERDAACAISEAHQRLVQGCSQPPPAYPPPRRV